MNRVQLKLATGIRIAWVALGALIVVPRLLCLPAVREDNLTPDGARYLNIARCIERGQGFSTPEAWPAWMNPANLPMPETFKEPGYPFAIAALTPIERDPFRAAQDVSLLAGLLLPFVVYALGRKLSPDPWVAVAGAVFAAASPLLIQQSAYVMAESSLTLMLTLAFLAAAPRARDAFEFEPPTAAGPGEFLAGACFGVAFLVRAQAVLAVPALVALLLVANSNRTRSARVALAALGATLALAPLVARNLRTFGTPFHSDVAAFGLWPYVDQFALTHSLERPPSASLYAFHHVPQVAAHFAHGLIQFTRYTLWHDLLGMMLWLIPLAGGLWSAGRRWRVWGFAALYLVPTCGFILSLNWVARYFASAVPLLCLLAALGLVALARRRPRAPILRLGAPGAWAGLIFAILMQAALAVKTVAPTFTPELSAARHEAAFLRSHLAPGEAVMAEMTSYWAWWSDRPAVYPVVADSVRFIEVMRRLRVRYAALPLSSLPEFAARSPGGHLPAVLRRDHEDRERDVTVFEVRDRP